MTGLCKLSIRLTGLKNLFGSATRGNRLKSLDLMVGIFAIYDSGHNLHETVTTVADLARREINIQVLEPTLDTSKPADKVVVNVMVSLAEWERELLVERTREGVAHARAQGRVAGPKPKLTDEQAQQARQLIEGGESISSVARSFKVSRQTLYRALERPSLTA